MGAMVVAVARHGYPETSVDELVALAGVSKSSFYRHFEGKEQCFLATFDEIVAEAGERIGWAYRSQRGFRERLGAGLERCIEIVAEEPAAARLVLVDSLSLGTAATPHRNAAAGRLELMLRQSFDEAARPGAVSEVTVRGLGGGVRRVVFEWLRAEEPGPLNEHSDDLLEWMCGYLPAEGEATPAPPPPASASPEPAGGYAWDPPDSPRSRATLSQRERLLRATAIVTAERGYSSLTVAAISATAGVSTQAFYEHFADKQEAFLAAFEMLSEPALGAAAAAFAGEREWAAGIAAGIAALLDWIAANELYARLAFLEQPAAGERLLAHGDEDIGAFTAFLDPEALGATTPRKPPPVVASAISGGAWAVIQHEVANGRRTSLPQLAPQLAEFVLTPFGAAPGV